MFVEIRKMIWNRRKKGKIKINNDVLKTMNICREKSIDTQKEYCGVLLGREILNSSDIIIDKITQPSKNDVQRKFYFFRDSKYHQKIIANEWEKSDGTCNYLGEWHTHLEDIPVPSTIDLKEWKKALKRFKFDGEVLFFIIIGKKKIKIWEGNKNDLSIKELD
jgi:integrative and conjugative element protein (TIGR02256 family)